MEKKNESNAGNLLRLEKRDPRGRLGCVLRKKKPDDDTQSKSGRLSRSGAVTLPFACHLCFLFFCLFCFKPTLLLQLSSGQQGPFPECLKGGQWAEDVGACWHRKAEQLQCSWAEHSCGGHVRGAPRFRIRGSLACHYSRPEKVSH